MSITMPTKPNVTTPQPAPKIGRLLGKGSLVLLKTKILEIHDPGNKVLARGDVQPNIKFLLGNPWTFSGDGILYSPAIDTLRIMDFSLGEDRFMFRIPKAAGEVAILSGGANWFPDGKMFSFVVRFGPEPWHSSLWVAKVDGTGLRRIIPKPIDLDEEKNLQDVTGGIVSPDGRYMLITGQILNLEEGNRESSAVYLMELETWKAKRVSPKDMLCMGLAFMSSDKVIMSCETLTGSGKPELATNIFTVDFDGVNLRQITHVGPPGLVPYGLSPDRTKICVAEYWHPFQTQIKADRISILNLTEGKLDLLLESTGSTLLRPVGFTNASDGLLFVEMDNRDPVPPGLLKKIDFSSGSIKLISEEVTQAFANN